MMSASFDPYHLLLGIAPVDQPPDLYRLLGIERLELNSDVIVNAAERQLNHLKGFSSGEDREHARSLCDQVSRAQDCLLDPESHRFYAAQLQGIDSQPADLAAKADWRAFVAEFDQAWRAAQGLAFDPQHHWLGIPLHQRPASNLRLLGLSDRENHGDVIRRAAERQISFVRKFASGEQSEAANDLLRQLSRARAALLRSINPDNQKHAEVHGHPQASAPVSPEGEFDRKPSVVEPDLADLDAGDREVPASMVPQSTIPVVAVGTQQRPKWILALVASAAIGLTLGIAGYISYGRLGVPEETRMAEPADQLGAPLEKEKFDEQQADADKASRFSAAIQQAISADPALIDLDALELAESLAETESEKAEVLQIRRQREQWETAMKIEAEHTEMARNQLEAYRRQLDDIQVRIDGASTKEGDNQIVFDLIENLGKLGAVYPQLSSIVDRQREELTSRAAAMLETMQRPQLEAAVKPESMTQTPPTPHVELQLSNQRPLFFSHSRNWTPNQGTSIAAIVVEVDEDRVVFNSPENGREVTMPLDQLIPADANALRIAFFGDQDNDQLEQTLTHVRRIKSNPAASVDALKQTHLAFRHSPYAGLWASVWICNGDNRHAEAASILRQVIKRIEHQRELDSSRHAVTLTSALNNLAVCSVKDHQADKAAGYLVESLETMPNPSTVVLHNARQLREFSGQPGTPLAMRSSSRRNLDQALKQRRVDQEGLPSGWHYSLDADLPRYDVASNSSGTRYLSQDSGIAGGPSSLQVRDTWCITCKGLGSIPCKYGNCNKGTIVVQKRVQVAVNPINGEPIYGNKAFKQSCPSCGGRGRLDCPHCEDGRL